MVQDELLRAQIANAYFVPPDTILDTMKNKAASGVDVRLLVPGKKSDSKLSMGSQHLEYGSLVERGVHVFEYQPSMMHAKTFVIDGLWSTIGSLNFDNRSLAFNNETNLVVLDSTIAAHMERMYLEDLKYSREITLQAHRQRSLKSKLLEKGANALSRLL